MKLLILFGPPAVGKTTVGQLVEAQTTFKLFHNHMIMDGVMHIFGRSSPAEDRLSRMIRSKVIEEAAEGGLDLIFTYVWNFALDKGKQNIDLYKQIYESRGGEVLFVELLAPLETRIARAGHADRHKFKAYSPDADELKTLEQTRNFDSPSLFFYPEAYTQIDTTNKKPEEIASAVVQWMEARRT